MSRPCPACNGYADIHDSRYKETKGYVYRRYRCRNRECGNRFSTTEILVEDYRALRQIKQASEKAKGQLELALDTLKQHPSTL